MPDSIRSPRIPLRQSDGKEEGGGAFTDPVFDDEYYGRDQAGGKARTIGLALGVIVGAVIAGTAAWFVFGGGAADRGSAPLIVAEPGPFKVRPEDPGGLQVENQDKRVYERLGGEAAQSDVENILPPPEAPRTPEATPPEPKPMEAAPPRPAPTPPVIPPPEAPEVVDTPTETPAPAVVEPEPEVQTTEVPGEPVQQAEPQIADPEPAPAQTLESMVAALSGDYLIQIAALRSEDAASNEWTRVSGKHPALLGGFRPLIVKADLGERGIFYRLRAGPLANRSDAEQLCSALAAENVGCLVVRNE